MLACFGMMGQEWFLSLHACAVAVNEGSVEAYAETFPATCKLPVVSYSTGAAYCRAHLDSCLSVIAGRAPACMLATWHLPGYRLACQYACVPVYLCSWLITL